MDPLTHALSGALIAQAAGRARPGPGEPPLRVRAWVGCWAALFPDVDGALRLVDELLYLELHRGLTHSLVMLPLWALLVGGLFHLLYRRRYAPGWMVFIAGLGIAVHILGDVITAYGTAVFAPVSDFSPALGWVLVIDPWLTLLLAAALAATWHRPRPSVAAAGLAVVVAFVLFQGGLNRIATALGDPLAAAAGDDAVEVRALAQPFSPFNRMVIVEINGHYERARVNLLRRTTPRVNADHGRLWRLYRSYRPVHDPGWERFSLHPEAPERRALVDDAWTSPALGPYRAFAHHPVFYRLDRDSEVTCVWFTDLRYWYDPLPAPFRFGGCRESPDDDWRLHELRFDNSRSAPLRTSGGSGRWCRPAAGRCWTGVADAASAPSREPWP